MDLYFLRHAIAVEPGLSEYSEEERPLTLEGIKKMTQAAQGMRAIRIAPTVILSSPLTRALETAQIVREQLNLKSKIEIETFLAPGGSFQDFLKKLKKFSAESLMLVGHEPSLSLWVQQLLECGPEGSILLKKGALAHLDFYWEGSRPMAQLQALLQSSMLRQMK